MKALNHSNHANPLLTAVACVLLMLACWVQGQTRPSALPAFPAQNPAIDPKLPTLWIIGDSTVRNGRDTGYNGQWGWGNPIASFFDMTKINVQNRAVGGTSSRTYMRDFWPQVLPLIKRGDFVIMQFGHNDSSALAGDNRERGTIRGNGDESKEVTLTLGKHKGEHEVVHSYGWYIRKYISDAKQKGAKEVVVCSPIPRNRWTDGKVNRDQYVPWAKEAAEQGGADFIDLNERVAMKYDQMGQQKVTDELFPQDQTVHPDWAGAVLNAQTVIEGLKDVNSRLTQYLLPNPPTDLKNPTGKAR